MPMLQTYGAPGVYKREVLPLVETEIGNGIPVFLGLSSSGPVNEMLELRSWMDFEPTFGPALRSAYLYYSVRGFFVNGGPRCYVLRLEDMTLDAIGDALEVLEESEDIDLLCAPDIMLDSIETYQRQRLVIQHCDRLANRFAILDSHPYANQDLNVIRDQRTQLENNRNAGLYYPWLKVADANQAGEYVFVPPCGAVAGIYASMDNGPDIHRAPANRPLQGVVDVAVELSATEQADLNYQGAAAVNVIRTFPGRGIRIWGARTLSLDENWMPINVRRLFIRLQRWVSHNLVGIVYEPNVPALWARVTTELTNYLSELFIQGALKGRTQDEAFYVKCDEEINSKEVRDAGMLIAEIGLAPAVPAEYIVLRLVQADGNLGIKEVGESLMDAPGTESTKSRSRTSIQSGIQISYIHYKPSSLDRTDEYVQIRNYEDSRISMSNWTLRDLAGHVFRFPEFVLRPKGSVRVWTKKGVDSDTNLYWRSGIAIWNNAGDQAELRDNLGRLIHGYQYTV